MTAASTTPVQDATTDVAPVPAIELLGQSGGCCGGSSCGACAPAGPATPSGKLQLCAVKRAENRHNCSFTGVGGARSGVAPAFWEN